MEKNETIFTDLLSIIIKNKGLYLYTVLLSLFSLLCKRNVTLRYSKRYRNVTATLSHTNALAAAFTHK
jgi:ACR3 family arsenite efflux pump ArsB